MEMAQRLAKGRNLARLGGQGCRIFPETAVIRGRKVHAESPVFANVALNLILRQFRVEWRVRLMNADRACHSSSSFAIFRSASSSSNVNEFVG